jgi:hypothetical protein
MKGRLGEALRQRIEKDKQKSDSTTPAHLDGNGKLLSGKRLTAGASASYNHGLGREPRGWHLLSPLISSGTMDGMVREVSRSSTELELKNDAASAAVTFDVWVY